MKAVKLSTITGSLRGMPDMELRAKRTVHQEYHRLNAVMLLAVFLSGERSLQARFEERIHGGRKIDFFVLSY